MYLNWFVIYSNKLIQYTQFIIFLTKNGKKKKYKKSQINPVEL